MLYSLTQNGIKGLAYEVVNPHTMTAEPKEFTGVHPFVCNKDTVTIRIVKSYDVTVDDYNSSSTDVLSLKEGEEYEILLSELITLLMNNVNYCTNMELDGLYGVKPKENIIPFFASSDVYKQLETRAKIVEIDFLVLLSEYLLKHIELLDQAPTLLFYYLSKKTTTEQSKEHIRSLLDLKKESKLFLYYNDYKCSLQVPFNRVCLRSECYHLSDLPYYIYCNCSKYMQLYLLIQCKGTKISDYLHNIVIFQMPHVTTLKDYTKYLDTSEINLKKYNDVEKLFIIKCIDLPHAINLDIKRNPNVEYKIGTLNIPHTNYIDLHSNYYGKDIKVGTQLSTKGLVTRF